MGESRLLRHPLRQRPPLVSVLSRQSHSPKPSKYPRISKRLKYQSIAIRNAPESHVGIPKTWTWMIRTGKPTEMKTVPGPKRRASTRMARRRASRRKINVSGAPSIPRAISASHAASISPDIFGNFSQCIGLLAMPLLTPRNRKHTGERPFQCHCSRRFSRLDNLRQHAQTVHVNEEIPMDSLAAAGTRFQRQLRTDRVRQPNRARAATGGSMGGPARGHAKSLSTSSISSVGSNFSTREDIRRRPPPLVTADARFQYPTEVYAHRPPSPSDFSTPTSATFSTGQNSPHWGSVMLSPASGHSRSHSLYAGSHIPARRLSVPSGGIPFQSQHGTNLGRPMFGPGSPGTMGGSHPAPFSPTSSVIASPTPSIYSRRESTSSTEDWRRRTWHPDSTNFGINPPGSRLSQVFTPSQYPSPSQNHMPLPVQHQQSNGSFRLPGIESFGPLPHRPASPLGKLISPMMVEPDTVRPQTLLPTANTAEPDEKRSAVNWDMSLHRGLTRLDITSNPMPSDGASAWARDANQAMDVQADRVRLHPPTVRFDEPTLTDNLSNGASPRLHKYTMSAPSIASSREPKRRGYYQNGISTQAEARPEKMARVDLMVHPNIREFSGFPARENPPPRLSPRDEVPGDRGMVRLETLVAVATGEGNTTKAY